MEDFDNYAFTKLVVDLIIVVPDLIEDAIYQSYLQIEDPVTSASSGSVTYEDFVCSIKYNYDKFGRVDGEVVWQHNYCGQKVLSEITTGNQIAVSDT